METRGVKQSVLAACVVLGLLIGSHRSEAVDFKSCYKTCFILCVIEPGETIFKCSFKCLKDCLFPPPSSLNTLGVDTEHFCRLGCSSSRCTNISTKTNPGEEEVSGCVDSCSRMCSKH